VKRYLILAPAGLLAAALFAACGDGPDPDPTPTTTPTTARSAATTAPTRAVPTLAPGDPIVLENATTTPSGLQYVDDVVGEGAAPAGKSDLVTVHYTGKFAANGQTFDSSVGGQPVQFALNGVIPGFSEAIQSMKEGGKRTAFIPSKLGYGPSGFPPVIPPDADLVFEIELIKVGR